MTHNEVKQEILNYLKKAKDSTAREIAIDLMWTEKSERNRMNKCLTALKDEGLIESGKVFCADANMMVNSYTLTPEGFDAIEPCFDPEDLELPPKSLPPKLTANNEYVDADVISVNLADEELGDLLDEHNYEFEDPEKLTKYMLVIEGETLIYNDMIEAHAAAESYAVDCNATVDFYTLDAIYSGQFAPKVQAVFKSAHQIKHEKQTNQEAA
ncbi:hypothetical protein [Thiomicrorhabdus sp.]|uniref:hypothetical protein n=1 Tax=Thiomicrorhabdus sp. TaxID=2039724 RepID=UPI0029C7415C|nr:hypothetical protein [Thiomicrorhabdus sp.]